MISNASINNNVDSNILIQIQDYISHFEQSYDDAQFQSLIDQYTHDHYEELADLYTKSPSQVIKMIFDEVDSSLEACDLFGGYAASKQAIAHLNSSMVNIAGTLDSTTEHVHDINDDILDGVDTTVDDLNDLTHDTIDTVDHAVNEVNSSLNILSFLSDKKTVIALIIAAISVFAIILFIKIKK